MFKAYINDEWVENFFMVSGVGENFAKLSGQPVEEDIFLSAIKEGLESRLLQAGTPRPQVDKIIAGFSRSNISWEREISAARITTNEIDLLAQNGVNLKSAYSIGISLGGTKIAAGALNTEGHIITSPEEIKWREYAAYNTGTSEGIVEGIIKQITETVSDREVSDLQKIGIAFAGPVDRENGIVGTPFPAPNLPFSSYNLRAVISKRLTELYGNKLSNNLIIDIYNDGAAAVLGEVSPNGRLARKDNAMLSVTNTESYGGIDFNAQNLKLKQLGGKIEYHYNLDQFENLIPSAIDAINPIYMQGTPVINLAPLLGFTDKLKSDQISLEVIPKPSEEQ